MMEPSAIEEVVNPVLVGPPSSGSCAELPQSAPWRAKDRDQDLNKFGCRCEDIQ